jgi:hypothetical protein
MGHTGMPIAAYSRSACIWLASGVPAFNLILQRLAHPLLVMSTSKGYMDIT